MPLPNGLLSFDEFVEKYNGKPMNFDGKYGNQCVDLFRFYLQEVLGIKQPAGVGGAIELSLNYNKDDFEWINNSITAVPQKGDIVIWKATKGNPFGHVAVALGGNVFKFKSFDINYPSEGHLDAKTGDFIGTGVAHIQDHNYDNVAGWLRPKVKQQQGAVTTMPNRYPTEGDVYIDLDNPKSVQAAVDTWALVVKGMYITKLEHNRILADAIAKVESEKERAVKEAYNVGKEAGAVGVTIKPNAADQGLVTHDLQIENTEKETKYIITFKKNS